MSLDITNHLLPYTTVKRMLAKAWLEGHAAGRDYQADGWNADAHNPDEDNPYTEESA